MLFLGTLRKGNSLKQCWANLQAYDTDMDLNLSRIHLISIMQRLHPKTPLRLLATFPMSIEKTHSLIYFLALLILINMSYFRQMPVSVMRVGGMSS